MFFFTKYHCRADRGSPSHQGLGRHYNDLHDYENYHANHRTVESTTGVKVSVLQAEGGEIGSETRPKNMNIIYIMRVF